MPNPLIQFGPSRPKSFIIRLTGGFVGTVIVLIMASLNIVDSGGGADNRKMLAWGIFVLLMGLAALAKYIRAAAARNWPMKSLVAGLVCGFCLVLLLIGMCYMGGPLSDGIH